MSEKISHVDEKGNPRIVQITEKPVTTRRAVARAKILFPEDVWQQLETMNWSNKKGAIFHTAIIAGIMGAKKTGDLIPLCHPIGMDHCLVEIRTGKERTLEIWCTAEVHARTGVEMEALTGASISALTVYDMCKGLSHDIRITDIELMEKTGGKRNFKRDE
jgi:cyclic pyranopterin phosphate synthase